MFLLFSPLLFPPGVELEGEYVNGEKGNEIRKKKY